MSTGGNNSFQLSRRSRLGTLVLLGILFALLIFWRILPSLIQPQEAQEQESLTIAWQKFKEENLIGSETDERQLPGSVFSSREEDGPGRYNQIRLFNFDPNTASEDNLHELGLSPSTIKTMMNYRNKGGKFYKKEELQKLYTLSKEDYERILPYVVIAGQKREFNKYYSENGQPERHKASSPTVKAMIDLNTADEANLMTLRGIGPVFSKRILNFRNGLGGFFDVAQLMEVYGLPDSTYQQLKNQVTVDVKEVKKLLINTATKEELSRHPYIGKMIAEQVIRLRSETGTFKEIEELRAIPLINDEKYRKIAPYLSTH